MAALAAASLIAAALLASDGTWAAAAPAIDARYRVTLAGLPVGTMAFVAESGDQEGNILSRFLFRSQGVFGLFGEVESQVQAQSRQVGTGAESEVVPAGYRGDYRRGERRREVAIDYGPDGAPERVAVRQGGVLRPGSPPAGMLAGTVDPVTAFFVARDRMAGPPSSAAGEITVPVFDGRRRYDLLVRRAGTTRVQVAGAELAAEVLDIRFHVRAEIDDTTGTLEPEEADHRDRSYRLTVTADARRLPLALEAGAGTGRLPLRAELTADCAAQEVAAATKVASSCAADVAP